LVLVGAGVEVIATNATILTRTAADPSEWIFWGLVAGVVLGVLAVLAAVLLPPGGGNGNGGGGNRKGHGRGGNGNGGPPGGPDEPLVLLGLIVIGQGFGILGTWTSGTWSHLWLTIGLVLASFVTIVTAVQLPFRLVTWFQRH
jgi:hypothetical protein